MTGGLGLVYLFYPLVGLVPPSHAKNRYLNSRLMILHASELATELFDEVQSPRCSTFAISIATAWFASRAWYYAIQNGV